MSEEDASSFDEAYRERPPWDIGRPQRAIVRAAEAGLIVGRVLDVGCGTGENALYLASLGHEVTGVDIVETAIAKARTKADERVLEADFVVLDALDLPKLGATFDTVVDSGLFHVFDDETRERYVDALGTVLRPGGRAIVLCFSDLEPGDWGPRRVAERDLRTAFTGSWMIDSIEPARFETTLDQGWAHAWLAVVVRDAPF